MLTSKSATSPGSNFNRQGGSIFNRRRQTVFANHKGGVGKSSTAVQFAYYLALIAKKRVLILDLDHQLNTTNAVTKSNKAAVSQTTTFAILQDGATSIDDAPFVLVPGARSLIKLEVQGKQQHNVFASNLLDFLDAVSDQFDACIIDTNGNPDIRLTAALVAADFVVSPIQLNQEAIDGIGDLLSDIKRVKQINKKLQLIGILPNMVEAKPFQKANFEQIITHYPSLLIMTAPGSNEFAHIPMRSVIPEAQAEGVPIWEIKKTAARDAWRDLERYFKVIANRIGLEIE